MSNSQSGPGGRLRRAWESSKLLPMMLKHNQLNLKRASDRKLALLIWRSLGRLSDFDRSLYRTTCFVCKPTPEDPWLSSEPARVGGINTRIASLNPDCAFCDIFLQVYRYLFEGSPSLPTHIGIEYETKAGFVRLDFCPHVIFDEVKFGRRVHVDVYSEEPHNLQNPFPVLLHKVCLDPASTEMIKKITAWIDECLSAHTACAVSTAGGQFIPKRLLKLDGDISITSPTEPVRYTALSYCWGTCGQPMTTRANLAVRKRGFSPSILPKTLQDAILFTQQLGLNYVWIDSLCIVQDDPDEWAAEAARMGELYSSAYVVLAATQSSSVAEGFLHPRETPVSILSSSGHQPVITVQARRLNNHDCSGYIHHRHMYLDHLPLSHRGWSLQETLLASRTVHFLPDEVFFQCRLRSYCECGLTTRHTVKPTTWPPVDVFLLESLSESTDDFGYRFTVEWAKIVQEYSSRCLTIPEDVLPALSGVAQRTYPLHPGQYIAGIWEKGIAFNLGWWVDLESNSAEKKTIVARPTFSWITAPGPVAFEHSRVDTINWLRPYPICALVTAHSTLATVDPFGRITSAHITLRGQTIPAIDYIAAINMHGNLHLDVGLRYLSDLRSSESLDGLASAHDWNSVLCFGLYVMRKWNTPESVDMLLLRRVPGAETFERIGIALSVTKAWFDERAAERTVTII